MARTTCSTSSLPRPARGSPTWSRLRAGEQICMPELADLLDGLGAEGPRFLYEGETARAISTHLLERGGLVSEEDLAAYEVVHRTPAHATYRGREILTNPPPSSGGI